MQPFVDALVVDVVATYVTVGNIVFLDVQSAGADSTRLINGFAMLLDRFFGSSRAGAEKIFMNSKLDPSASHTDVG